MGRRICALPQDQNFPLTHARSPFPRISSSLLLFDEHAGQIFAMTDEIAERPGVSAECACDKLAILLVRQFIVSGK